MIEEITIKFGTELKSTQASWKSQLYSLHESEPLAFQETFLKIFQVLLTYFLHALLFL